MYIPKSKYKPAKYTNGEKFTTPDGKYYTGWYVETFRGEFLSGKVPSSTSIPLLEESTSEGSYLVSYKFTNDIVKPTKEDYSKGYFYRYFIQDRRSRGIIECNLEKYKYFTARNYILGIEVKWTLKGPAENINKGLYIYFGAASKNEEAIKAAELTTKGLSSLIKSYSEFVK
jgi:hypothetical protein